MNVLINPDKVRLEWRLLELLSLGVNSEEDTHLLFTFLSDPNINWGELIEQAIRHRMISCLALHLSEIESEIRLPRGVRQLLEDILAQNKYKIKIFREESHKIYMCCKARKIPVAFTKGIILDSLIYGEKGERMMNDIDLMILPGSGPRFKEILTDLGYTSGVYDSKSKKIRPHHRKYQIQYNLNPDHLPKFARLLKDPFISCIDVDVATSLSWSSSDFQISTEKVFENLVLTNTSLGELPCFSEDYQFLFTIMHLFRHAWFEKHVKNGGDVMLCRFTDIIRLWNQDNDKLSKGSFTQIIKSSQLERPVAWVLAHTDDLFGSNIIQRLNLESKIDDAWKYSAKLGKNTPRNWTGTMQERLMSRNRSALFSDI